MAYLVFTRRNEVLVECTAEVRLQVHVLAKTMWLLHKATMEILRLLLGRRRTKFDGTRREKNERWNCYLTVILYCFDIPGGKEM